jgi:DNA-binding SARP family transcriptional activator/Tfp pilus assembly protein PilF
MALLSYLALARGRRVPRERLMALVWPDADTEQARRMLRDSLYRLREALGDEAVPGNGDDVRLDPDRISCDVWAFEDAAAAGDDLEADRRYAGPFLDGFFLNGSPEFEQWADGERRRLMELHGTVLERLASSHAQHGRWTDAVQALRRLVARDPYNARRTVMLMQGLDAAGDRAGALRQAATHAQLLREEFGTGADADVEALAERLRSDSAVRGLASDEIVRATAATGSATPDVESETRIVANQRYRRAAFAALAVTALAGIAWYATRADTPILDRDVVAVMPFHVTAPDSTYDYLGEGVVDLAGILLTGEGTPRAVDPRAILTAYHRLQRVTETDLTIEQCLTLARRFGAAHVVTGELVITPDGSTMNARLIDASSGEVLATHTEHGTAPVRLTTRLIAGVLAKSHGEGSSRLAGLSDSVEAVRAYLRGMQTYRGTRPWESFDHFSRAMEIDPQFATAAMWRAFLAGDAYIFGTPPRRRIDSAAWALRHRLSRRDSLVLVTLPSIGPNYPEASTARQLFHALERAAEANPDRIEVLDALATHLQMFGAQASVDGSIERAIHVADRALEIDPDFLSVLSLRTYLALLQGDSAEIRRHGDRFFTALSDTSQALHWRWAVARALGDSAGMQVLLKRIALRQGFPAWLNIELWAIRHGLSSIADAEQMGLLRMGAPSSGPEERAAALRSLFRISAIRGRASDAIAMADTASRATGGRAPAAWEGAHQLAFITLGIVGPGFDDAAAAAAEQLETRRVTRTPGETANDLCLVQLWRVSRGDTTATRQAISRMRELVRTIDPGPGWRVTRLGLCPLLLEAALEWRDPPPRHTPALDRVQALLLDGPQAEMPGNVARILVARWREHQGRYNDALALLRGVDPMAWSVAAPAVWINEGRVAALAGDTTGAMHAYSRYLSLRDQPDPGPLAEEVQWVRDRLAELRAEAPAPQATGGRRRLAR